MRTTRLATTSVGLLAYMIMLSTVQANEITDLSLEELLSTEVRQVSSASRIEQLIAEAPAAVTVLSHRDIRRHGWRTLSDLLRSAPGINISYNHLYSSATIRGMSGALDLGSYLLLLIDGERMTGNVSDVSPIEQDMPIDMDWIERVEIVTGASSAVYGANAVLAVVNIITRQEDALSAIETSATLGSNDSKQLRLAGRKSFNGGHVAASVSRFTSDGHLNNDGNTSDRLYARIAVDDFNFTAWKLSRHKDYPYIQPPVFNEGHTDTEHISATLNWRRSVANNLHANISLQYGQYDFTVGYGNRLLLFREQPAEGRWYSLDASLSQVLDRHTLVYGIEYMSSPYSKAVGYISSPVMTLKEFDNDHSYTRHALYIQDIWKLTPDLHLHLALRHEDDDRMNDSLTIPRLGLVYQANPATALKITYGESFRAHPAFELGALPKTVKIPLQFEPPEQVNQWEFRIEHDVTPVTRLETSLYHIRGSDQVRYYPGSDFEFTYGESSSLTGLESGLTWRAQDGSRLRASLTLQNGEYDRDGARLFNSPDHLLKLNYSRPLPALSAFIGVEALYSGKRKTLLDTQTPAYGIVNLTLSSDQRIGHWDWQFGIYNLFDKYFEDPAPYSLQLQSIEQEGRSWRAQASFSY